MALPTNDSRLTAMARDLEHRADIERRAAGTRHGPDGEIISAHQNGLNLLDESYAIRAALKELADLRAQVANFKEGTVSDAGD